MRKIDFICVGLLLLGLLLGVAHADTFELTDGRSVTGEVVSSNESGLIVRLPDGTYSERIPWTRFNQADLRRLAQDAKMTQFVEPFIEVSQEELMQRNAIDVKPVPRLERQPDRSLLGALFSSGVGVVLVLFIYAANIYAAFEIAVFRARPKVLVCAVAAVLPILGPIIFLSMPTKVESPEEAALAQGAGEPAPVYTMPTNPEEEVESGGGGLHLAPHETRHASGLPPTQTFQRGAFTFNRRFFETKFPNFFGAVKREADKDMVLAVKASKGNYIAHRITRISASDVHLEIHRGHAPEEVSVGYGEIQEIQLKHKDA